MIDTARIKELREWLKANEFFDVGGIQIPSLRVQGIFAILDDYERARPLLEAVDGANYDDMEQAVFVLSDIPLLQHSIDILRAALAHKEKADD